MPGPPPKDPKIRQRRNQASSKALLPPESAPILVQPELPVLEKGEWSSLTQMWWDDIWDSPLHNEFLRADLGSLFRLAILVNRFFTKGSLAVATEIRLLEREFGLTPLSRRRLEWTVAQTDEAVDKREVMRAKRAKIVNAEDDPRDFLEE